MKNIGKIAISILIILMWATPTIADTYGPYRFKTGIVQTHARWELTLELIKSKLFVKNCVQSVTNYVVEHNEMSCWDDEIDNFNLDKSSLVFRDGSEIYSLDLKTKRLVAKEGDTVFADVVPGKPEWDTIAIYPEE